MGLLNRQIAGCLDSASWIRRMFEQAAELRAVHGAENVFDFSLGNPHLEPPAEFVDRLRELAADPPPGMHRYMPNPGFPEVRAKVARDVGRREGVTVPPDHVVMTCGAAGAINVVLRTLLEPGDEVIILTPIFAEYRFYVMHAGGTCRLVDTDEAFDIDADRVAAAINERTRAVMINSPNNPSGRVYPEASIDALVAALESGSKRIGRPIVLLSDDPYRRLVYDGVSVPTLLDRYEATILVSSFSKDLGLAGARIGYLAMHPDFPEAAELLAGMVFCLRTLGFVNAPAIIQLAVADCLDSSVDVAAYRRNRDALVAELTAMGYEIVKPEGAFYLFPKSPIEDDQAFIGRLLEERILAVPGVGFARPGYFRLSYAVEPGMIEAALPGFRRAFAG